MPMRQKERMAMDSIEDQLKVLGLVKEPTPPTLVERLRKHDWFWGYSDQYLSRAAGEEREIQHKLEAKSCKFAWWDIYAWLRGHHDGFCYKVDDEWWSPKWPKAGGSAPISNVITKAHWDEIQAWMEANAN